MAAVKRQENKHVKVELLSLVHSSAAHSADLHAQHVFAYRLRITNESQGYVVLNARKWILEYPDGEQDVYEGDKIVGKVVALEPEESFEYGSFHLVERNCDVSGSYHGYSQTEDYIWVRIPKFHLHIPDKIA